MKKAVFSLSFVLVVFMVNAQNPADLANSSAVSETQNIVTEYESYPENKLTQKVEQILAKQGKSLGAINEDGSIYIIASASTARQSNMPGFIGSRNVAFSIAELTAKMDLLRMAGEQITSGRGFTMLEDIIEGEDPDAVKKASMLAKAGRLMHESLDEGLASLGVSQGEIDKMNESEKQIVFQQNFNETIKSLVAGMVKGCAVLMVAEGEIGNNDYQVSICVKYSPEYQSLASLIKNNSQYQLPVSRVKNSVEKMKAKTSEEMAGLMGAKVTFNSSGEMIVFGYGQVEVREVGSRQSAAYSRAYSKARLQAVNKIKYFVSEDIVAEEAQTNIEKLREYSDGTNAYYSRQKWENSVKSKSTTLNIATQEIRRWQGVHPISQHKIAGVVVAWTLSNKQQADHLKNQLNNSPSGSSGSSSSTGQPPKTTKSKVIITGDEDDF